MEALKERAKARGLWNLFLSRKAGYKEGVNLTNVEVSFPQSLSCLNSGSDEGALVTMSKRRADGRLRT